jgi:predicted TIM-barrel fold metal-dependent hydrolase
MTRKLITTDSHLVPPPWLLNELPESLREKVSGLFVLYEERADGRYLTFPADKASVMMAAGMPGEIKIDSDEQLASIMHFAFDVDAVPAWDPAGRLREMDRENVVGSVLIGNPVFGLHRGPDYTAAQVAWCQVVNDWLADTFKDHLGQFAPGIHLPYLEPAECAKELERAAAMGLRPGVLPDGIWDQPYWKPEWEPLWEAAAGLKVPLSLHIAAIRDPELAAQEAPGPPEYGGETFAGFYGLSCDMGKTLIELTFSGVFKKYPDLTVVMTEGYAFWMAGLMQFCDHHWEGRFGRVARAMCKLDALPSHYMKRQAKATFMWDPVALNNRAVTGIDCLMWGNDYPHPEGIFPDSQQYVEKQFAGMPENEIEAITYGNAQKVFGFTG